MSLEINSVYQEMLEASRKRKRDITSSTIDVLQKSHPKSPIVLDFEAELFGLAPEDIKKLPIQSVEMLQNALTNLVSKTKDDPMLRQALRRFINNSFSEIEKEVVGEDEGEGSKGRKKRIRREGVEVDEESDDLLLEKKRVRNVTADTWLVVQKSMPKSNIVLDFASGLLGLDPISVKKLPQGSVEMIHRGIVHLLSLVGNDPMLLTALKTVMKRALSTEEGEKEDLDADGFDDKSGAPMLAPKFESTGSVYRDFLSQLTSEVLSEAKLKVGSKVTYLDKKGVKSKGVCKKINAKTCVIDSDGSDVTVKHDQITSHKLCCESVEEKKSIEALCEGIADSEVSPSSILLTFGIGTADTAKKDALAEVLFAYDRKFTEKNAGKAITWKVVEAAFAHNKKYLQQLFKYATQTEGQTKILAKKIADINKKEVGAVEVGLKNTDPAPEAPVATA